MPSRRSFLTGLAATPALAWGSGLSHGAQPTGLEEGTPFKGYRDEVTGARVRILTDSPSKDQVVYQTHPQWTPGMDFLVFTSDRSGGMKPHSLEMATGTVRCLAEPEGGGFTLARKEDRFYYQKGKSFFVIQVRVPGTEEPAHTKIADFPDGVDEVGEMTLDGDEKTLYCRTVLEPEKRWGILALEIASGKWSPVTEADFKIGHLQANPFVPGLILFCWETGGDAPQRTWLVRSDGSEKRPFYKETFNEWVTHEVWWKPDRALFTVWPYDDEHLKAPHGVASADLATGELTIHSQYKAWHTHGSPDGNWIMGDDFERNLWLIQASTGERRLLTQGHLTAGGTNHPHASFTPDSRSIVFTSSREGTDDIYLVDLPEWDTLPLAP